VQTYFEQIRNKTKEIKRQELEFSMIKDDHMGTRKSKLEWLKKNDKDKFERLDASLNLQ
jgi:hypothetical protein